MKARTSLVTLRHVSSSELAQRSEERITRQTATGQAARRTSFEKNYGYQKDDKRCMGSEGVAKWRRRGRGWSDSFLNSGDYCGSFIHRIHETTIHKGCRSAWLFLRCDAKKSMFVRRREADQRISRICGQAEFLIAENGKRSFFIQSHLEAMSSKSQESWIQRIFDCWVVTLKPANWLRTLECSEKLPPEITELFLATEKSYSGTLVLSDWATTSARS